MRKYERGTLGQGGRTCKQRVGGVRKHKSTKRLPRVHLQLTFDCVLKHGTKEAKTG